MEFGVQGFLVGFDGSGFKVSEDRIQGAGIGRTTGSRDFVGNCLGMLGDEFQGYHRDAVEHNSSRDLAGQVLVIYTGRVV